MATLVDIVMVATGGLVVVDGDGGDDCGVATKGWWCG